MARSALPVLVLAAAVAVLAAGTNGQTLDGSTNILVNGGFESTSPAFEAWTFDGPAWELLTTHGQTGPQEGSRFIRAALIGAVDEVVGLYNEVDLTGVADEVAAGRVFMRAYAYFRTWDSTPNEFGRIRLAYYNGDNLVIDTVGAWHHADSWTELNSGTFAPATATHVRVYIEAYRPSGGSTDTFVDNVRLVGFLGAAVPCDAEAPWDAVTNATVSIDCAAGFAGTRTRACDANGNWGEPDESGCASCNDAVPAFPVLDTAASGVAGDRLSVVFTAPTYRYNEAPSWSFVGSTTGYCDSDGAEWSTAAAGQCLTTHTATPLLAQALRECGFSAEPQDGGDFWFYEAVVEATTVEDAGSVFGDDQTRTSLTTFRVRVELPKTAAVSASATVFGAVIDQAALTEQTFNAFTQEFGWNLATSVQYPYYLEPVSTAVAGHTFDTLPVVVALGDSDCSEEGTDGAPAACRQEFALSANETDDCRLTNAQVTTTFQILCRPQYAGSCDLPEGNTTTATFFVTTDDFCPQVVEVASVTPALTTYSDSGRTSVSTNYILETTLFARVTADVEAGLRAQRTTLTGLDIVSSCTGCGDDTVQPFTDGLSTAATAYGFAWEDGGTDNSATGEVQTDFSFTLNTNSLSFDNDATTGEAQITLTAFVSVEYDTPSAQGLQRSYRVEAVSSGSVGSSATAQASVSSPAAGGASSTAGSSVLGVSAGVVVAAVLGLAAVAAVSVGAAVAARKRRKTATSTSSSSSSSSSLSASLDLEMHDVGPAPGAVPTHDLETVRSAYV